MINRFIVHFTLGEVPPLPSSSRPETRMYSTRGFADNRMALATDWVANLVEVWAPTVQACEETLEEYR